MSNKEKSMKTEPIEIDGKKYQEIEWQAYKWIGAKEYNLAFKEDPVGYKILRPIKEKPMPEILPGDFIEYQFCNSCPEKWLVYKVEDGTLFYRSMIDGTHNSWAAKYFAEADNTRLYRNGKLIWSKGDTL